MKKIDWILCIAFILLAVALTVLFMLYYNLDALICVSNPVEYANINNQSYWWDFVQPIDYNDYFTPINK